MKIIIIAIAVAIAAASPTSAETKAATSPVSAEKKAGNNTKQSPEACLASCRAKRKATGTGSGGEKRGGYCLKQCGLK